MDHSLGRETVTLLEGATSLPKTTRSIYNGEASDSEVDGHIISNTIAPDETILMFDRLRELSEKSLNLEVKKLSQLLL